MRAAVVTAVIWALLVAGGVLESRHYRVVTVSGGSMRPALAPGDLVVVRRQQRARVGGIALFADGDGLVLHRVVGVTGGAVRTRGDANPVADRDPVPTRALRGIVVGVVPVGAWLSR